MPPLNQKSGKYLNHLKFTFLLNFINKNNGLLFLLMGWSI